MSSDNVLWHFYLGYIILGLLLLRLLWGFIGPKPIRLRTLIPTPKDTVKYIRKLPQREPSGSAGHNPVGSIWILLILALLIIQGISGLFIDADDFYEYGPLYDYVSEKTSKFFNGWHYYLSNIILGMVVLHIGASLFYLLWKKENLITPMLTGWKWVKKTPPSDK